MTSKPERRWPLWPWLVLTLAGVGITTAAAVVGAMADPADDPPGPGPRTTVTVTEVQVQPSTVTRTVTPPPPPGPAAEFGNGLHEVGADVQPGTFRTEGPDGSNPTGCYWSRIDASGDLIDNGVLRAPGTVTVNTGELFDTAGCQPWRRAT